MKVPKETHRRAAPRASDDAGDDVDISAALLAHAGKPNGQAAAARGRGAGPRAAAAHLQDGAPGAGDAHDDASEDEAFITDQMASANRKTKGKKVKASGGFQSMGLSMSTIKAITGKGFRIPTPIQRKTIPVILQGRDVVGMARTGSGKTAAFVIPMIERLKARRAQRGIRALILSPSRELALQTVKVVKDFSRGTDLNVALVVGGDSLESQFSLITNAPDIVVATPGRFLHLKVEMSLDLAAMEYVVFDEADRLFEMGFAVQLNEILHALPPQRQTCLFSATLPSSLVEFAKAGLQDPVLIRLDVDSKISAELQSAFFSVKSAELEGALLYLLQHVIKLKPASELPKISEREILLEDDEDHPGKASALSKKEYKKQKRREQGALPESLSSDATIVFAPTKHHVEYLTLLLTTAGYAVSQSYSSLDQVSRRVHLSRFRAGATNVLVVTDVAARGIDIPILANVVNYDFPAQPKVFVHRVGRTARAGRTGWAYSLVKAEDCGHLIDVQLFLGRQLVTGLDAGEHVDYTQDIVLGSLPREGVERATEWSGQMHQQNIELQSLWEVCGRAFKLYSKSRAPCSASSAKRAKELTSSPAWSATNPLVAAHEGEEMQERNTLLARLSHFRPSETIFEIGNRGLKSGEGAEAIRERRKKFVPIQRVAGEDDAPKGDEAGELTDTTAKHSYRDKDFFIDHHAPKSVAQEAAYSISTGTTTSFSEGAQAAILDLVGDETGVGAQQRGPGRSQQRWDAKKRDWVRVSNDIDGSKGQRLVRSESGGRIPASFKSGRYEDWKAGKRRHASAAPTEESGGHAKRFKHNRVQAPKQADKARDDYLVRKRRVAEAHEKGIGRREPKSDLKTSAAIRKERLLKQKRQEKNARPSRKRDK